MKYRIESLERLEYFARARRSVICPKDMVFCKAHPAAFIIRQSGAKLLRMFREGMFLYEKPQKKKGVND